MTPVSLQDGEFQYYASAVLVKNNRFFATLTNLRLIIEGSNTRDFKVMSIRGVFPENIGGKEPGLKISFATPTGHKDMIFAFPVDDNFKKIEQQSWIDALKKAIGEKPFATGPAQKAAESSLKFDDSTPIGSAANTAVTPAQPKTYPQEREGEAPASIMLNHGETIAISTTGVRVKHTFYNAYLTNLRLILQNNLGKIGREFAIAELVDAAAIESESGEPEIAISIGMQGGLKQMIIVYPTTGSRDGWMQQLQNRMARKSVPHEASPGVTSRIGTFVPATNERVIVTTPNVRIKNRPVIVHLTNTRFIVDSTNGVVGDFAITTVRRFSRMASEIGEPGISLKIIGTTGDRDMHLVFSNFNDREAWMDALTNTIPNDPTQLSSESPYTVTRVTPKPQVNTQTMHCPSCGSTNPVTEERCGMCGSLLHQSRSEYERYEDDEPSSSKKKEHVRKKDKHRASFIDWSSRKETAERKEYTGGVIGFISRPRDAFEYYAHESPSAAFPTFLVTGAIWALLTTILVVYVLPKIIVIDTAQFPILAAIEGNILLLVIIAVILWIIWILAQLLQAAITSVIAHLFEPSVRMPEVIAMTMRCSLTYAVVGWIPILGLFAASIWAVIETVFGLRLTQDTSPAGSIVAPVVGVVIVYVLLFFIGGGFSS